MKDKVIPPGVPVALGGSYEVKPVTLPLLARQPAKREFVKQDLLEAAREKVGNSKEDLQLDAARKSLIALEALLKTEEMEDAGLKDSADWKEAALKTHEWQRQATLAEAKWSLHSAARAKEQAEANMARAKEKKDSAAQTQATRAMATAKKSMDAAKKKMTSAEKAMGKNLTTEYTPRKLDKYPNQSSGRRLAFARWLTRDDHPLTARVAMNHIWLRHFGQPIVPTVAEFGGNGREPTHPALLDWLAAEMVSKNWSMKEMHRLICTSTTYRMSGTTDKDNLEIDPDNLYLWRMPSRRMEGEIVRDNILWIAGTLDPKLGGADISYKSAQTSKRRSIYLQHAHEKLVEFVQIFDGPESERMLYA